MTSADDRLAELKAIEDGILSKLGLSLTGPIKVTYKARR